MERLNLSPRMLMPNSWKQKPNPRDSSNHFVFPLEDFIKLNFYGATKGNLGAASSGGVFRDHQGNTIQLFAMDYGTMSNNEAKLYALKQGLEIARRENFQKIEVEGDSTLVIDIVKKLQQGTQWDKLIQSWRTIQLVQEIGHLIQEIDYIIPTHV